MPHTGTDLALRPHDPIAFTWVSPKSTAENSAHPGGNGTLLPHTKVMTAENRDGHAVGWGQIPDALVATPL